MSSVIVLVIHTGMPMSPDVAGVVLAVGLVVLLAVAYDYYRHRWIGGR